MALEELLARFLAKPREWRWGECDCGLWLADWYSFATGQPDPAAHLRGAYSGQADCAALYGGAAILRWTRTICRRLELEQTLAAETGGIGVVVLRSPKIAFGAIRGARGWIVPGETGLTRLPDDSVRVAAAWRIAGCRFSPPL